MKLHEIDGKLYAMREAESGSNVCKGCAFYLNGATNCPDSNRCMVTMKHGPRIYKEVIVLEVPSDQD